MGHTMFLRKGIRSTSDNSGSNSGSSSGPDSSSNLPNGYTPLLYIESSGTQYIDTDYTPNNNTKVVMDFQLTNPNTSNQCIFGVAGQFSFRWYGTNSYFRSNGSDNKNFSTAISSTDRHIVEKTATTCTIDGTYSVTNTAETVSLSLYLCAQHAANSTSNYASVRVYSCQIYDNDTLVRDYIPCFNPSGEIGLYDKVNDIFYSNAGSTEFVARFA